MDAKSRLGRIDFQRMFADYCQMEVFRGAFDKVGLPTLTLTWGRVPKKGATGSCSMKKRGKDMDTAQPGKPTSRAHITINIPPNGSVADVIQTTMHELVHAAGWMDHSHRFYNTLRAAVDAAHGVDCNHEWTKVYEYDEAQRDELDAVFGSDMSSLPLLPPGRTYENPTPAKKSRRKPKGVVLPVLDYAEIASIVRGVGEPANDIFAEALNGEA
jgi:hypothetical protein